MKKRTVLTTILLMLMVATAAWADDDRTRTRVIEIKDGTVIIMDDGKVVELDKLKNSFFFGDGEMVKRGFLGVYLQDLTPELREHFGLPEGTGVLVSSVSDDGPAEKAGLKAGDIIIAIDGEVMSSSNDVGKAVGDREGGDQVRIEVDRKGATEQIFATLKERERPRFRVRSLPGDLNWIDEQSGEAMGKLKTFLESPEWKVRVNRLGNCDELQSKIEALEKRLQDLERLLEDN